MKISLCLQHMIYNFPLSFGPVGSSIFLVLFFLDLTGQNIVSDISDQCKNGGAWLGFVRKEIMAAQMVDMLKAQVREGSVG